MMKPKIKRHILRSVALIFVLFSATACKRGATRIGRRPSQHDEANFDTYGTGGFGGLGGRNSHGVGGYGKSFGGGFGSDFDKNAFRNGMGGLLVWNVVSGSMRHPYYVYNYYNNPEKVPHEILIAANLLVVCPQNATALCAPNTVPLCVSNSTILCVVLAQQAVPCNDKSTLKCVNSTVTCTGGDNDPCVNNESKNVTTWANIPCVTNATIIGVVMDKITILFNKTRTLDAGDMTNMCVTTLAVPQSEEDAKKGMVPLCNSSEQTEDTNATMPCSDNSTDLPQPAIPAMDPNVRVPNQNITYPYAM